MYWFCRRFASFWLLHSLELSNHRLIAPSRQDTLDVRQFTISRSQHTATARFVGQTFHIYQCPNHDWSSSIIAFEWGWAHFSITIFIYPHSFVFFLSFWKKNGAAWWWDGWPAVLATHKFRIGTFIITLHDLPVLSLVHGIAQTNWWSEIFIIPWRMAISLLTRALAALRHHRMDVPCACACACALCIYYILGHNFNEMSTV